MLSAKAMPTQITHPRDEDGPTELYFGFWIFQFHIYLYEDHAATQQK